MKLTIVIPALNEEEVIARTIEECQSAANEIVAYTVINEVDIVIVSDGSTDRTVKIAKSYSGIRLIIFKKNRGYGAAIKAGWEMSQGDFLAFLDADGTCDPRFFVEMCQKIETEKADVIIGSRMGKNSKMPIIRRIGNIFFSQLLRFLSKKSITDSASGMRVVRSSSLNQLLPLPDGLHFTPAMSTRVLMDSHLKIVEIYMTYEERIGQSKLSVINDGFRFLKTILSTVLYIRPFSLSIPLSIAIGGVGLFISINPIQHYLVHGVVLESMIYRFILLFLMGSTVMSLLCFTVISEHTIALSLLKYNSTIRLHRSWWASRRMRIYLIASSILLMIAFLLILPGIEHFLQTGRISQDNLHWSRMMLSGFVFLDFVQMILTALSINVIDSLNTRQAYLLKQGYPISEETTENNKEN